MDLGRVNLHPIAERLGTKLAQNPIFLDKAYQRSIRSFKSKRITQQNILSKPWVNSTR